MSDVRIVPFPRVIVRNGRIFFVREEIENYKRLLAGIVPLKSDPERLVEFVTARKFAAELGTSRRTIARKLMQTEKIA
jgi:hypothetical protein